MHGCLMWLLLLDAVAVLAVRLVGLALAARQSYDVPLMLTADEVRRLPQRSMPAVMTDRPTMGQASALGPEQALRFDPPPST